MSFLRNLLFSCSCCHEEEKTLKVNTENEPTTTFKEKSGESMLIIGNSKPKTMTIMPTNDNKTIPPKQKKRSASFCMESAIFINDHSIHQIQSLLSQDALPKKQSITQDIITKAKKLLCTNTKGTIFQSIVLTMDAGGIHCPIPDNYPHRNDGVTLFHSFNYTNKTLAEIDYVLQQSIASPLLDKHLFAIFFLLTDYKYYLKLNLLEETTDQLIRLSSVLRIKLPLEAKTKLIRKTILIISQSMFQISFISNTMVEISDLDGKKRFIFNPFSIQVLKFGRDSSCSIRIENDDNISTIHTTMTYDKQSKGWNIQDGDGITPSGIGTFICSGQSYEIMPEMQLIIDQNTVSFQSLSS